MIDGKMRDLAAKIVAVMIARSRAWLAPAFLRRRTFGAAFMASILAAIYWGLLASDRYVSEAQIIIQRTDLSSGQTLDFSSLLGGISSGNESDQMLLRAHLLSVDMMERLNNELKLREHYSDTERDILSRMWSKDVPIEWFHRHYMSRISVDYDVSSGALIVRTQAYDPEMAYRIAVHLVDEGESYMNQMAHRLAEDQVAFLEKQVAGMSERAMDARRILLAYQNKSGLASPQVTAENVAGIINKLESQLAELQTQRSAMLGYLMPQSASVVEVNLQIKAIEKQIAQEMRRLASPQGSPLNQAVEEYQRLQMNAEFSQDMYKTALVALEKGRIESIRTLKKVSILQSPTKPQYPLEPRRIYNVAVFILMALLIAGIIHLVAAIIRDHQD